MSERRIFHRALGWSFAMTWGQRGLATVFTIALAAILGPHDFGVLAMAIIYVQLIEGLLEQGLGTAIIQREDLRREHLDSAFWLNLGWGVCLAGLGLATSGLWAKAMGTPEVRPVVMALSGMTLLVALAIVQEAYLQRAMEFKKLAVSTNIAALGGGAAGITLALSGAGVWALVAQQLVTLTITAVVLWVVSPFVPSFRFSWFHARQLLGFSIPVFFANLAGFVGRRGDVLLMGAFFGPVVVGVYRLADRFVDVLLELTMRPIGAFSLPRFSRLQNDPEGLKRAVSECIGAAALTAVPALLVLAVCAEPLLRLVGEEWVVGATALQILALVGIAKALVFFTGPLLFARARARFRAVMLWSLALTTAATVVAAGLLLRGASETAQLIGMSGSRLAVFVVVAVPLNIVIIRLMSGLTLRELAPSLKAPFAAGALAVVVGAGLEATGWLSSLPSIPALVLAVACAASAAGVGVLAFEPRARHFAREALTRLRSVRQTVRSASHAPKPIEKT